MKISTWPSLLVGLLGSLAAVTTSSAQTAESAPPLGFPGGATEALGEFYQGVPHYPIPQRYLNSSIIDIVRRWNEIAINATGLDHTPVQPGERRVFGQQLGPTRSSRAMAMVHLAMFEASNAIVGGYQSYAGIPRVTGNISYTAAVAQAAHDTLLALYPSQKLAFDEFLAADLAGLRSAPSTAGIALGSRCCAAVLALRSIDGSATREPRLGAGFITGTQPGNWRQDPISQVPIALGAFWSQTRPFVMQSASQFVLPPPPALNSPEYAAAYAEAKRLGGDGVTTPTERTADQTFVGTFWAYDGTPSLCAPPRLYNQITVAIADKRGTPAPELARLLALANLAMADAGIAAWESKYRYQFWRPVTGIRESGGVGGAADATYSPLGAPASNLTGPNFTPPFPAYPSGHAAFGGALFQTLRRFYGTDHVSFTFVSDEYNGVTQDNHGHVRPFKPRAFRNLTQPEEENGQSRIYLGIHWSFDKTAGIAQGRNVGNYVFDNALRPVTIAK